MHQPQGKHGEERVAGEPQPTGSDQRDGNMQQARILSQLGPLHSGKYPKPSWRGCIGNAEVPASISWVEAKIRNQNDTGMEHFRYRTAAEMILRLEDSGFPEDYIAHGFTADPGFGPLSSPEACWYE